VRSSCCGGSNGKSCETPEATTAATCKAAATASATVMSALILKRGSVSRPSGQWRDDDYDVLENGVVVGRIFCLDAVGPQARPWIWASGHNGDIKRAAYGYEPTREAAMAAFAKSWRRE
jgi:hypothetical protein